MKLTYQAPAYRHIALDEGTAASGCVVSAPHTSSTCAYTMRAPFRPALNVFFSTTVCSTLPGNVPSQYTGSGGSGVDIANVFGS